MLKMITSNKNFFFKSLFSDIIECKSWVVFLKFGVFFYTQIIE